MHRLTATTVACAQVPSRALHDRSGGDQPAAALWRLPTPRADHLAQVPGDLNGPLINRLTHLAGAWPDWQFGQGV